MAEKKYGLIGKTLKHSYSKVIHNSFGYEYELCEILPEQLEDFVKSRVLDGYNVTIPYKQEIIKYLDEIDDSAKIIGAVNTVINRNGKLVGFNTDFYGMFYSIKRYDITLKDKVVMILGSGGTSQTAKAVAERCGAKEIIIVSRKGEINYDNCYKQGANVIINTTPVGMYPNSDGVPVDLTRFSNLEGVFDVVYNPLTTKLVVKAKELGLKCANGLDMLVAQAKYAMELFFDKIQSDDIIETTAKQLKKQMLNIVLIGMPGSGKSTIGRKLAGVLGREFIDTDELVEKNANKTIPKIFESQGENIFREHEKQAVKQACSNNGKIIATGGGVVINIENLFELKKNGRVYWVNRSIEKLETNGRPLSKDLPSLQKLYDQRKDKYELFADVKIDNDGDIENAVKGVLFDYENFSN